MTTRGGFRAVPVGGKKFWEDEHWRAVLLFANELINEGKKLTFNELAKMSQDRAVQAGKLPKGLYRDPQAVQTALKKKLFPDAPKKTSLESTTKAIAPNGKPSVVTEEDIKKEPIPPPKSTWVKQPEVDKSAEIAQAKIEELEVLLAQATAPEIEGDRTPGAPLEMTISDIIVKSLLSVVYDPDLRRGLKDLVREALAPESTESQERDITWPTPTTTRPWKPRVVVTGGDAKGHARIKEALKYTADLRFFSGQHQSDHRLVSLLKGANIAVAHVNYGSHNAMYKVKGWEKGKPGRVAIYWNGAQNDSLVKELENAVAKVREEVS